MNNEDAESPTGNVSGDSTATAAAAAQTARVIGNYRIVRKLGQGGMGVVYEAEQQHPRRHVALKVIRSGMYVDEQAVKLFQREAQALARLKHPGIADIYEAGRTESGEHFFAMELVRGVPVLDYVRSRSRELAPASASAEVLRLFCDICHAINYAHQRGVIHRDLKPTNILVSTASGIRSDAKAVAEVKILDFGLARITDADIAVTTILTEAGQIQGTLAYMSPEQARGNADEIDVRSDVYSLGVILFELLLDRLPYEVGRGAPLQALRVICEEPPHLETRSGGTGAGPRLDRDLETILIKALAKEPSRRYQSALALAEDVERYLEDQPILARPPSTIYQVRKLIARHRKTFALACGVVLLLAGFAAAMTLQSARIARERDRAVASEKAATQVATFLVELFRISDPAQTRGNTVTVRELLDRGAARITRDLESQPLVQARLMDAAGRVYDSLGLYDEALPLIERALATRRQALGENDLEVATSQVSVGTLWWHRGEFGRAEPALQQALTIRERLLGPESLPVAASLHNLGNLHFMWGNQAKAQPLIERSLSIREKLLPPDDPDIAATINSLGAVAFRMGQLTRARQLWERTLAIRERVLGPEHPHLAQTLNNLAVVQTTAGDAAAARPLLERVVRIQEKTLGPKHTDLAFGLSNLGDVLMNEKDFQGARSLYRRAVEIQEGAGPQHPELGRFLNNLARATLALGDVSGARVLFTRSLSVLESSFGKGHFETARPLAGLANCDRAERRLKEAEAGFERALGICRQPNGSYSSSVADILDSYATFLRGLRRDARAAEIEALARAARAER